MTQRPSDSCALKSSGKGQRCVGREICAAGASGVGGDTAEQAQETVGNEVVEDDDEIEYMPPKIPGACRSPISRPLVPIPVLRTSL